MSFLFHASDAISSPKTKAAEGFDPFQERLLRPWWKTFLSKCFIFREEEREARRERACL